jgi:hypothetical protein
VAGNGGLWKRLNYSVRLDGGVAGPPCMQTIWKRFNLARRGAEGGGMSIGASTEPAVSISDTEWSVSKKSGANIVSGCASFCSEQPVN